VLIVERWEIAQDYLKAWFWIDFVGESMDRCTLPALCPAMHTACTLSCAFTVLILTIRLPATFPFEVFTGTSTGANKLGRLGKIFRLLRIFKLLRILKLGRILRRLRHSTNVNPNWYLLGRTVSIMVFMLHWTACGYWMVVENQPADSYNRLTTEEHWLPPEFIRRASFNDQYAYAFFWSISVTTGTGWDIIPATALEV
jgi:hypothetical protein